MSAKDDRKLAELIRDAQRPKSCPACGMTFSNAAAYTVAHDGRCLPPGAYGQLVDVDGVWCRRGSETASR